ncbi:sensor histidine kinase [Bradyrhizobium sp. U87765 SZCCT0131]|uniref:sensor histidine kinase n=1 Tax=unclassified Bradyrhizobium TaxID=2631580 RepID=UPI001BAC25AE|nr:MULTISPECIES: ATP-binding protein [unclassified Bradyrhizobium]MBR1220693.1 sensor histidine kinase [Bradyrhizobium sp. U87765 SZCCT0131]MBR1262853.1 sensor histidine kinase [Bradyrhizobium sp. U87765 SZCCT0134]MBR1307265.1 sensor histidine kinase [Bradyrhizobium sp. U87765 SZCCT0110]MBR1322848.1 sensor histidine kinase [Bradyrhizobium sp. U87765 SZCCT0109]MBR1346219.1 sensor histidine kinase [Bradyrhizobium sp. U87765 SZCCT0048]
MPSSSQDRTPSWLRQIAPLAAAVLLLLGIDQAARLWAEHRALGGIRSEAEATASQRVAVLQSEIEKQRTLPFVLAQDPDVQHALTTPTPELLDALNQKLASLSTGTRAAVIYLLNVEGLTIAASNHDTDISFVGNNYAFRPYYRVAMDQGHAEHFAYGTISHRQGLYLSRRIESGSQPIGVIVVKVEFDAIETQWHRFAQPIFVTDDRGIVLVTSEPSWRFKATAPLSPQQQVDIRASLQFGEAPLDPLPLTPEDDPQRVMRTVPGRPPIEYIAAAAPVPGTPWTLHLLAPTRATLTIATTAARSLAVLAGVVGFGTVAIWWTRRRNLQRQRAQAETTRRDLEQRVHDRTTELQQANGRLQAEMDERRRAEEELNELQDDLVQANKLAILGQIAASVAHEINQPVAAIRTFADNGAALLDRNDVPQVRGNLAIIAALTDRIGTITGELRAFARKSPAAIGPVSLRGAVDGALLLVGHRLRQQAIRLELALGSTHVTVAADPVRLEQVFVNLLQNAIEALDGRPAPHIRIAAIATDGEVHVTISDNGPGLPERVLQSLFVPFTSTKPTGLGLGLVISKDILTEFGGSFSAHNGTDGGAVLSLTLPRLS